MSALSPGWAAVAPSGPLRLLWRIVLRSGSEKPCKINAVAVLRLGPGMVLHWRTRSGVRLYRYDRPPFAPHPRHLARIAKSST